MASVLLVVSIAESELSLRFGFFLFVCLRSEVWLLQNKCKSLKIFVYPIRLACVELVEEPQLYNYIRVSLALACVAQMEEPQICPFGLCSMPV